MSELLHAGELILAAIAIVITLRSNYKASNKAQNDSIFGKLDSITKIQDNRHEDNLKIQGEIKLSVAETKIRVANIERHIFEGDKR